MKIFVEVFPNSTHKTAKKLMALTREMYGHPGRALDALAAAEAIDKLFKGADNRESARGLMRRAVAKLAPEDRHEDMVVSLCFDKDENTESDEGKSKVGESIPPPPPIPN